MASHPIQPLELDARGIVRFKANTIVRYLLDNGGIDLNKIACLQFPQADQEQFAQLIGYSHSGFGELSYVSDETYEAAGAMFRSGISDLEARNQYLREQLEQLRENLREPVARLYGIHPDDLKKE